MRLALPSPSEGAFEGFLARLQAHATRRPDAPALEDSTARRSWGQLFESVQGGAGAIAGIAAGPGQRVALLAENSVLFVEAFLAIVGSGCCAVTIPTLLSPQGVARILDDSAPALVLVTGSLTRLLDEAISLSRLPGPPAVLVIGPAGGGQAMLSGLAPRRQGGPVLPLASPEDDFNIVYSSGTTAEPKGILHTCATRVAQSRGLVGLGFDEAAVTLISTPLYTNLSIPALLATLWSGGLSLIMGRFDEQEFLDLAERRRATHFFLVPIQVQRLLDAPGFSRCDLKASRLVYVAGSMFHAALKRRLREAWPGTLVEVYGMTEGAPASALFIRDCDEALDSVGQPFPGCLVRVIDEQGAELPVGETGEIVGHSGTMMKGYNNRPAETAELIWRDADGRPYFRSGDLGYLDGQGFLHLVDRKKDMLISGGINVYPSDIEAVALMHADVAEVAVVGVASARWGETPVAVVVPKLGSATSPAMLRDWINARVARHQRVDAVTLRRSLPRNALGKVLKKDLRRELDAGRLAC